MKRFESMSGEEIVEAFASCQHICSECIVGKHRGFQYPWQCEEAIGDDSCCAIVKDHLCEEIQ